MGHAVVIDTRSGNPVYLGMLAEVGARALTLRDADVHDTSDSRTPREIYVMESKKFGVKMNRREVQVRLDEIVSISRLEDVVVY